VKKRVGLFLACSAIVAVLVWGFALGGLSTESATDAKNSTPANNTVGLSGSLAIKVGKIRIDGGRPGQTSSFTLPIENGANQTVYCTVVCRQPDFPLPGYVKGTRTSINWFDIEPKELTLQPGTLWNIQVKFQIPAEATEGDFVVYSLTEEGQHYLEGARASTVGSEEALAMAFKEELKGCPDIYSRFDAIYADRGDSYVFKAMMDAYPQYYPNPLVDAWERAVADVKDGLSAVPYANALAAVETFGSLSQNEALDYPEIFEVPDKYIAKTDLRSQPWEMWVTVTSGESPIQVELACRVLIHMAE
jgi:hypothetical protein